MKYLLLLLALFSITSYAEIAVIVHPSNNVAMSKDEVARIYLGKTRAFPDGSDAVPVALSDDSELSKEFLAKVLGKSPKQLKSYWAKMVFTGKGSPPKILESTAKVLELVANNPNLVGYVNASEVNQSVKVINSF